MLKTLVHKKSGSYFFGAILAAVFVFSFFLFAPTGITKNISGTFPPIGFDFLLKVALAENHDIVTGDSTDSADRDALETVDYDFGTTDAVGAGGGGGTGSAGSPFSCGFVGFFGNFGLCSIWLVGKVLFTILAWVVMLSAMLLQFSIDFNMNIKQFLDNTSGVDLVWSTVRDLANILFIFFLLWTSIQTILGMGDGIKKALPHILLAALLINFSMFTTRVIIDASNIVSLQFYSSMTQNDHSIDESLLRNMRLQGFFNKADTADSAVSGDTSLLGQASTKTNLLIIVVLGSIFLIIAAFAFLNAAFLFIARVVVLTLLVATSPIAFIASILPQRLQKYHKMWWDNLWDQMLVAPVFLLMLWVILKISGSMSSAQMGADGRPAGAFLDALNPGNLGTADTTAPLFNFLILIGLLIAAVKVTKELSGSMGASITSMGGAALGMAAGGVGGFALRNSLGKLSHMAARSETLKNWSEAGGLGGVGGRALLGAAKFGQKTSFDARALGDTRLGGIAGAVTGATGVGVGFGKAGGEGGRKAAYEKAVKGKEVSRKEEAEAIKTEKLDMIANPLGDTKIDAENTRRKAENIKRAGSEEERLKRFAQRINTGTVLDKVQRGRFSNTAVMGSVKAAGSVAKDLKKKQDQEKNLTSRSDRIEAVKVALGAAGISGMTKNSMDADVIAHYQSKVKSADDDLELKLTSATPPASGEIEKAEKLVRLYKGKLNEFENDIRERDRLAEALGKKPDEKKP